MNRRPTGVIILAILFATVGILGLKDTISQIRESGTLNINLGIIYLPVAFGLLTPRPHVRRHAKILIFLYGALAVVTVFILVIKSRNSNSSDLTFFSLPIATSFIALAASCWGFKFLSSQQAKNFYQPPNSR